MQRPTELVDSRNYIKQVKRKLNRKFRKVKQRIRQYNNRVGQTRLGSNVKMHKPAFLKRGRKLMIQNFVDDPMSGRRRLVGLSELDVSRDVMDFKYITTSDQEAEPIEFFLEMKQWDENGIGIQVHYSNPLMVGKGNDNIITTLKNPGLFAPASGEEPPSKDQGTNFAAAPPQVPKGVDEEELKSDATTACTALITIMVAMVIIQVYVKGNFRDFWGLFFVL